MTLVGVLASKKFSFGRYLLELGVDKRNIGDMNRKFLLDDFLTSLHFFVIDSQVLEVDTLHGHGVLLAVYLEDLPALLLVLAVENLDNVVLNDVPVRDGLLDRGPSKSTSARHGEGGFKSH